MELALYRSNGIDFVFWVGATNLNTILSVIIIIMVTIIIIIIILILKMFFVLYVVDISNLLLRCFSSLLL